MATDKKEERARSNVSKEPDGSNGNYESRENKGGGMDWKFSWKKLLYGLSFVIALGGSLILLVFTFLINDAVDKAQKSLTASITNLEASVADLGAMLDAVDNELDNTNTTLEGLRASITPLASGLRSTGSGIDDMADAIGAVNLPGLSLSDQAAELHTASISLQETATKLSETTESFEKHKTGIASLKAQMMETKAGIAKQQQNLEDMERTVNDVCGLVKLANLLFFFVIVSMFAILVLDSVAGVIGGN